MNAGEVMSHNPIAVPAEAGLTEALRLMFDHRISGLPVVDSKAALVGILTEGDLLRRSELGTAGQRSRWLDLLMTGRLASEYVRTNTRRVSEIMTHDVVSVAEDTPLPQVVRLMERHRIKRVPVMRDGALIGIVSRADLLHALHRLLVAEPNTFKPMGPWVETDFDLDAAQTIVRVSGEEKIRFKRSRRTCLLVLSRVRRSAHSRKRPYYAAASSYDVLGICLGREQRRVQRSIE